MSKLIPSNTGRDRVNETRRKNRVVTGKRGERDSDLYVKVLTVSAHKISHNLDRYP